MLVIGIWIKVLNILFCCFLGMLIFVFWILNSSFIWLGCCLWLVIWSLILFCFVNFIVFLIRLYIIWLSCKVFFISVWGIFVLIFNLNFNFFLWVLYFSIFIRLYRSLFGLKDLCVMIILLFWMVDMFRILLIMLSNKFEDCLIVFIYLNCFVLSGVLMSRLFMFKMVFMGVCILWFMLVMNCFWILVVCFVIFCFFLSFCVCLCFVIFCIILLKKVFLLESIVDV